MDNVFASGGLLARHLPGFAARAGQLAMARAVATILDQADDESATLHRRNGSAPENRELTEYEFTEYPEIKQSETNPRTANLLNMNLLNVPKLSRAKLIRAKLIRTKLGR